MGIELLERAAAAGGRILRTEQLASDGASADPLRGEGYLMTFDVGRVLVRVAAGGQALEIVQIENPAHVEVAVISLVEEEPWWRVVGDPLTRVWPGADGAAATAAGGVVRDLRLQFREDAQNPKVISFKVDAGAVRVGVETSDHG